ncbi:retrovirus-related pol polyprotein from transposon TNT 1-94 [Tanacetum coccineum]
MANLSKDIQCAGLDTRPPILDRTDFASWQQWTFWETLTEGTEGALHLGLPKDIYSLIYHYTDAKDIWDNVKMLLEGSELTKEDHELQLHFSPKDSAEDTTAERSSVVTACYTQNRSLIHTRHDKTPYELVRDKKPDLTFFCVFGALCYPTNDNEDLGKLQPTADIGIFVGYAPSRKGYRIYNKRTRQIMETIHVNFDELTKQMALVQPSTGPAPSFLTPR